MRFICYSFSIVLAVIIFTHCFSGSKKEKTTVQPIEKTSILPWQAPDTATIPNDKFGELVRYGRDLIVNTAYYIGPEGVVSKNLGNKMNCSNCHLDAGTRPFAFNFLSSHARYPQYRSREDKILSLADRVNNCIERPHNGRHLKIDSREMLSIISYIKWLGQNVPVNTRVPGDAPMELKFMERPADPDKGEVIYIRECKTCHGADGEGLMRKDGVCYENPPLWGKYAYQPGSSMHRIMKAASFIYANMPNKNSDYLTPKLTMEEAFDVAAFINDDSRHKRPMNKNLTSYPNIANKPLDYGRGPYVDTFSEEQHKFGPWQPILEYRKTKGLHTGF